MCNHQFYDFVAIVKNHFQLIDIFIFNTKLTPNTVSLGDRCELVVQNFQHGAISLITSLHIINSLASFYIHLFVKII